LTLKTTVVIGTAVVSMVAVPSSLWLGTKEKEIITIKTKVHPLALMSVSLRCFSRPQAVRLAH
jgi:hypothetical protein